MSDETVSADKRDIKITNLKAQVKALEKALSEGRLAFQEESAKNAGLTTVVNIQEAEILELKEKLRDAADAVYENIEAAGSW